jgi:hypothetical protein
LAVVVVVVALVLLLLLLLLLVVLVAAAGCWPGAWKQGQLLCASMLAILETLLFDLPACPAPLRPLSLLLCSRCMRLLYKLSGATIAVLL